MQPNFNDFAKGLGVDLNSNKPTTPKFSDTLRNVYQSSQQQEQKTPSAEFSRQANAAKDFISQSANDIGTHVKNAVDYATSQGNAASNFLKTDASIPAKIASTVAGAGSAAAHGVGEAGAAIGDILANAVKGVWHGLSDTQRQDLTDIWNQSHIKKDFSSLSLTPQAKELLVHINEQANKYPEVKQAVGDALNSANLLIPEAVAGTPEAISKGAEALNKGIVQPLTEAASTALKGTAAETTDAALQATKTAEASRLQAIQDTISPKPTVGQARLATDQGTLYKGNEPTLFKGGTPDKVAATDQQLRSVQTIDRLIPGADKMDEPTLYSSLKDKIGETAKNLQPELQASPLKPETVQKISDDASNLAKEQLAEAKATDEPNLVKWQAKFQKYLPKGEEANLNDLWESAKDYDASIKENVKKATDLSSEDLQTQKDIWLQNRAILRDAITQASEELNGSAKQAFAEMRDMYEAQNGILSKAKIVTKPQSSLIKQTIDKNPIIKAGVKAAGLGTGVRLLP
jgi:hypothetical protein